jgi:hypothetical protein
MEAVWNKLIYFLAFLGLLTILAQLWETFEWLGRR